MDGARPRGSQCGPLLSRLKHDGATPQPRRASGSPVYVAASRIDESNSHITLEDALALARLVIDCEGGPIATRGKKTPMNLRTARRLAKIGLVELNGASEITPRASVTSHRDLTNTGRDSDRWSAVARVTGANESVTWTVRATDAGVALVEQSLPSEPVPMSEPGIYAPMSPIPPHVTREEQVPDAPLTESIAGLRSHVLPDPEVRMDLQRRPAGQTAGPDTELPPQGPLSEHERWELVGIRPADRVQWTSLASYSRDASLDQDWAEPLQWALAWLHTAQGIADAEAWATACPGVATGALPVFAAAGRARGFDAEFAESWGALGFAIRFDDVGVLAVLKADGWSSDAVTFLAHLRAPRTDGLDREDIAALIRRHIPPELVLDGARAGLPLKAAISTAEATLDGVDSDDLLRRLIERRAVDGRLGAHINIAVAFLDERIPRSLWAIPVQADQRLTRSIQASLPRELWSHYATAPTPGPPEVEDPSAGFIETWNRQEDSWYQIDPPEDRAVQPDMAWTDEHQIATLREYLGKFLRYLEVDEFIEMSWPPIGNLWNSGSWGYNDDRYCDEHGDDWDDGCDECADSREQEPVSIHDFAEWHWHCRLTTLREDEDQIIEVSSEYWQAFSTEMDPREVHFQ